MKINEIRYYPERDFRLVNMITGDKEYAYSVIEGKETFEVYYLDPTRDSGYKHSRSYSITNGDKIPKLHSYEFDFLKKEFNSINWETVLITGSRLEK